jgi:hypothetical protein
MKTLLAVALIGCASSPSHPEEPVTPAPKKPVPIVTPIVEAAPAPAPASAPAVAPTVVQLKRTSVVLKHPGIDAGKLGVIRKGARAEVMHEVDGDRSCARWLEIAPRGWLCESAVEPTDRPATTREDVALTDDSDPESLVPGVYGVVYRETSAYANARDAAAGENGRSLSGSNTVRAAGVTSVDGKRYWITTSGELVDTSAIATISPSHFKGVALDTPGWLPAWVRAHGDPRKPAVTRDRPNGKVIGSLAPRTVVTILERSDDERFVRIADDEWISRADLRAATLAEPPTGAAPDEKWFDVDLDDQVLVAYEGTRPVYATLVSTGKWQHETPVGVTRVVSKHETARMDSDKPGELYSVADVPWTMYYDRSFALHTSYWHDGFGGVRSHGCVNLSPRDARILYHWSSPDVPPGWITVYGDADNPGSLVRVHSRHAPEPAFRGYAKTMLAAK